MTPHLKHLVKAIQMKGHNICFYAELTKNYSSLSSNIPSYLELYYKYGTVPLLSYGCGPTKGIALFGKSATLNLNYLKI